VRGLACDDCVVTVLLGPNIPRRQWDPDEMSALDALADAGLVPPLRLVEAVNEVDIPGRAVDIDPPHGPEHSA
jgi:hypothetical protein